MNKPLARYFAGAVSRKSCNRRVKAEKAALPRMAVRSIFFMGFRGRGSSVAIACGAALKRATPA